MLELYHMTTILFLSSFHPWKTCSTHCWHSFTNLPESSNDSLEPARDSHTRAFLIGFMHMHMHILVRLFEILICQFNKIFTDSFSWVRTTFNGWETVRNVSLSVGEYCPLSGAWDCTDVMRELLKLIYCGWCSVDDGTGHLMFRNPVPW